MTGRFQSQARADVSPRGLRLEFNVAFVTMDTVRLEPVGRASNRRITNSRRLSSVLARILRRGRSRVSNRREYR